MNKVIDEIIPFYNMLLWLNMRTNSKKDMVLGESVLTNTPFNTIDNTGLKNVVNNIK